MVISSLVAFVSYSTSSCVTTRLRYVVRRLSRASSFLLFIQYTIFRFDFLVLIPPRGETGIRFDASVTGHLLGILWPNTWSPEQASIVLQTGFLQHGVQCVGDEPIEFLQELPVSLLRFPCWRETRVNSGWIQAGRSCGARAFQTYGNREHSKDSHSPKKK